MKKSLLAAVAAVCLLGTVLALPAHAQSGGAVYGGVLSELNNSGASGSAKITVADDGLTMTIEVNARNLNLNGPHAMHLHGKVEGNAVIASTCPTDADDGDGDGVLTVLEGAPKYGGVQVSLTTNGDTSADSALAVDRYLAGQTINYNRAGIPIPEVLRSNEGKLHVVVHGIDENGNGTLDLDQTERSSLTDDLPREATAPALCGTLTVQATGPVQTGGGGTASDSPFAMISVGAGFVALSGAAFALRRRDDQV